MASINPTYLKDIEIIIYVSTIQIYQSDFICQINQWIGRNILPAFSADYLVSLYSSYLLVQD